MLFKAGFTWHVAWFAPLLFLVIRPLSVHAGLMGRPVERNQRHLIAWFGIRGIGSIYYLMYAIDHGLDPEIARPVTSVTLWTIALSVVLHGVSVTPLMTLYQRTRRARPDDEHPPAQAAPQGSP
jgi:NhaP-type Na+/H+ or K+/H+ antiporter